MNKNLAGPLKDMNFSDLWHELRKHKNIEIENNVIVNYIEGSPQREKVDKILDQNFGR